MSNLRQAAQQALEALEDACGGRCNAEYNPCFQREIATALRAALAEPEKNPFDGDAERYARKLHEEREYYKALFTAPTPRKPLTDEEILRVLMLSPPEPSLWPHLKGEAVVGDVQLAVIAIARAIERAHGIGEQT